MIYMNIIAAGFIYYLFLMATIGLGLAEGGSFLVGWIGGCLCMAMFEILAALKGDKS